MRYDVLTSSLFDKEYKKLCKKYKSAKNDIVVFVENLRQNPLQGIPLGKDCYKIRLAITSKGKGKSSGARLITSVRITHNTIYLLSIYDKSEQVSISDNELDAILRSLGD
ncbi:type II toxin-antitoxin system RelE/ParE family toxin [Pedobacter endophyticus]|uniref:Type II toxin-antitoxin system RelE/ParE family toxin n=1 Tax=Pedobacter endophyticus TaxID=2789740 RepID=A0A7U3SNS1_9SPHI|nr:type II toxin-antitoxin system RelE/ParE family toxin [Pedobacter endophyticus]QPH37773.1 type II toxin-antitoxin system RelE/ParE family toxin [Pedobacter endophyticus]